MANFSLSISQWKVRLASGSIRHFYGNIYDDKGKQVQMVLQCNSSQEVIKIATKWAENNNGILKVVPGIKQF